MVPSSFKVPVPFGYAFAHGVLALGVEAVTDFERRDQADSQARDPETGRRLWAVTVMDLDPLASRFGRDRVKVKIVADAAPTLPASTVPGYPPAVAFTDLVLVPWVDDSKCRGSGGRCRARMAFSMRASTVVAADARSGI
jgi:hypothetical protein